MFLYADKVHLPLSVTLITFLGLILTFIVLCFSFGILFVSALFLACSSVPKCIPSSVY